MFRHLFVKLTGAAAKGDMAEAQALAAQAIETAEKSRWPHLTAVIHFALGSALMARGQAPEAIARYQRADASAEQAALAGEPSAPAIRVNARLGAGAALLAAGAFDKAAEVYEGAAALAEEASDTFLRTFLQIECRRMAAYSHERAGARERAWAAGMEALRIGGQMSAEERSRGTLAYVGEGLLRIARRGSSDATEVEEQMTTLLGPDWRPKAMTQERMP
jgi:tetratricopeptide (TPR) repeat protein